MPSADSFSPTDATAVSLIVESEFPGTARVGTAAPADRSAARTVVAKALCGCLHRDHFLVLGGYSDRRYTLLSLSPGVTACQADLLV